MQTSAFRDWLTTLKDRQAKAKINARLRLCETAGMIVGDHHSIGEGVSEMRFHFGAGYRVYYSIKGNTVILLLAGGDKSSQNKDIKYAQQILNELKKEQQW